VDGTVLEPLASKKLQRKLKPIFETVVERTTFPIHSGETDLEVAVDHGFIKADGRCEPISEIEIELKHGDPSGIAMVADRLAQTVSITYAARSKAERGYALSTDEAAKPVRAATIDLDPEVSTADAFQTVALSCLDHAIANARAVCGGGKRKGSIKCAWACVGYGRQYQYSNAYYVVQKPKPSKPSSNGWPSNWDRHATLMF
jgi:inorganic triphosphatase YgiF